MKPKAHRVLIVDDEPHQVRALGATLERAGYSTQGAANALEALALLRAALARSDTAFDVLVTDLRLPGTDGIELLRRAQEIDSNLVAVVMTGEGTIDTAVAAMRSGALDYIIKPFNVTGILTVLSRAVAVRRLRLQNTVLLARLRERTWELEIANRELRSANRELTALARATSHDLKGPLDRITASMEALLRGDHGPLNAAQSACVQDMMASGRRLAELTGHVARFAKLSAQPLHRQGIDMDALAIHAIQQARQQLGERPVEISVGKLPPVSGDRALLQEVFTTLIAKALAHIPSVSRPRIEIQGTEEPTEVNYTIRDNGAEVDPQLNDSSATALSTERTGPLFESVPVDVWFAHRIVERHGGKLTSNSSPHQGSRFTIHLPLQTDTWSAPLDVVRQS
jgi:signal transduction histidine kinase